MIIKNFVILLIIWAHSICSNFELLADESRDLFQAEKKVTDKQIHNDNYFYSKWSTFWVKLCEFAWDKSRDSSANNSKLEQMELALM